VPNDNRRSKEAWLIMANFRKSNILKSLGALLFIVLTIGVYIAVGILSSRYFCRIKFGSKPGLVLGELSKTIVNSLKSDVEIFVLLEKTLDYNDETFDLIQKNVRHLMDEYANCVTNVAFNAEIINVGERANRYADLCRRFGILPANCVIVTTNNKVKVLAIDELYKKCSSGQRNACQLVAFQGEWVISSALNELANAGSNVAYFTVGHGECDLDSASPSRGLSVLKDLARQKNLSVRPLNLYDSKAIPDDAKLVAIVGARNKFLGFEREILRDFVDDRNGKLVIAMDGNIDIGLGEFLIDHGIYVVDSPDAFADGPTEELVIEQFAPHEINKKIIEFRVSVMLGSACEVRQSPPWLFDWEKFKITELMQTSGERSATVDPEEIVKIPYTVAVISERKKFNAAEMTMNAGKILVVGNSDFLTNSKIKVFGNMVFWQGISDYMLPMESSEGFETTSIENYRIAMSGKNFWKIILRISFLPIGFLMLTAFVAFLRRK
jgi:hypothetical protein